MKSFPLCIKSNSPLFLYPTDLKMKFLRYLCLKKQILIQATYPHIQNLDQKEAVLSIQQLPLINHIVLCIYFLIHIIHLLNLLPQFLIIFFSALCQKFLPQNESLYCRFYTYFLIFNFKSTIYNIPT